MKILDDERWEAQKAELVTDGEVGQAILGFVIAWADAAEAEGGHAVKAAPAQYLRSTIDAVERERGRFPIGYIGSMLVLLAANWAYGEELSQGLTPLEFRLMADVLTTKIAAMQAEAEHVEPASVTD
jgi:hypothetical protein